MSKNTIVHETMDVDGHFANGYKSSTDLIVDVLHCAGTYSTLCNFN